MSKALSKEKRRSSAMGFAAAFALVHSSLILLLGVLAAFAWDPTNAQNPPLRLIRLIDFMVRPLVRPTINLLGERIFLVNRLVELDVVGVSLFWNTLIYLVYGGLVYATAGYVVGLLRNRKHLIKTSR